MRYTVATKNLQHLAGPYKSKTQANRKAYEISKKGIATKVLSWNNRNVPHLLEVTLKSRRYDA